MFRVRYEKTGKETEYKEIGCNEGINNYMIIIRDPKTRQDRVMVESNARKGHGENRQWRGLESS